MDNNLWLQQISQTKLIKQIYFQIFIPILSMLNTNVHPTIHKINSELNKLDKIIQTNRNDNLYLMNMLKNCQLSAPSSSSSILVDDLQTPRNILQNFTQTESKNLSSIHSNNLSDTFEKYQSSIIFPLNNKSTQNKNGSLFKKYRSGNNSQGQKSHQNYQSTLQPSKQTVKKGKVAKSNLCKVKKQTSQKNLNFYQKDSTNKFIKLGSQKNSNNKLQAKNSLNYNQKKQKIKKVEKQKDYSKLTQNFTTLPTKTQQSRTEVLNSKRNKENYVSVPHKQIKQKNMITFRHSSNKFQIDFQKQIGAKITDLKLKENLFQLQKKYFLTSIKITKEEIDFLNGLKNSNSSNEQIMLIFDSTKQILSSLNISGTIEKEKKLTMDDKLKKSSFFIRLINNLPDTLKNIKSIPETLYKKLIKKFYQILENANNKGFKSIAKTSIYNYYISLYEYFDFFVKNNLIKTTKQNKSVCSKNQEILSYRNPRQQKLKTNRIVQTKNFPTKKYLVNQIKKQGIPPLKRVSTVKILSKPSNLSKKN